MPDVDSVRASGDEDRPVLSAAVVQVLGRDGAVVGAGFVASDGAVVTCAHVVRAAGQRPGDEIELAFPNLPGEPRTLGVVLAEAWRSPDAEDLAVVRVDTPSTARNVRLGSAAGCRGHRVSSFGFPAQAPPGGHFGHGVSGGLLQAGGGEGRLLQLTQANELTTGFSGGPVLDEVTGLVIGMVTSITAPDEHLRGLGVAYATPVEVLREAWPGLGEQQVAPYRGLEPFTADDADWFKGRGAAEERVLSALGRQRRVLLLGPSGAGKSSLLQAGVLPILAEGSAAGLEGSEQWIPVLARPGQDLLAELERAGLSGAATDGIARAVETMLTAEPEYRRVVLVIDQFEEFLTQPVTGRARSDGCRDGVEELMAAVGSRSSISVILVMRDDFYPRLAAQAPELLESMEPGVVHMPASLSVPELHAIITEPAEAAGAHLEDQLPERIVTDLLAADPAGQAARRAPVTVLPLLEVALTQLWDNRRDGYLTHRTYQRIGTVTGSLSTWCDTAIAQLPVGHRPIAQRILTALVRPGDDAHAVPATCQQMPLDDLRALATTQVDYDGVGQLSSPGADQAFEDVLAALTNHRIISTRAESRSGTATDQPTAELIHDALIRDWSELRDWVAADHQFHAWLRRCDDQRDRWARSGHPGDLLGGTDLDAGIAWSRKRGLPDEITVFLAASQRRQRAAARRTRIIAAVLACLLVLALLAAGIAVWQQREAVTAQQQAVTAQQISRSQQLAAQSQALLDSNPELASLLAIQAYRTRPTAEATLSLRTAAELPLQQIITGHSEVVTSVAFSPDGTTLATAGEDRTARIWDARTGRLEHTLAGNSGHVKSVVFSPDGATLATAQGWGASVKLWDVGTGELRRTLNEDPTALKHVGNFMRTVAFSPDGTLVAAGSNDSGKLIIWDVRSGRKRHVFTGHGGSVNSVAFSPDGSTLAGGVLDFDGETGQVSLWDSDTGELRRTILEHKSADLEEEAPSVAFSPNGTTLATAGADGSARLWDAGTGRLLRTFAGHRGSVASVAFSADGTSLATAGADHTVRLWDVEGGELLRTLTGHTAQVTSAAFGPDGTTLAAGSADHTVRVWDLSMGQPERTLDHKGEVTSMAFSPVGTDLATASRGGPPQVWDTEDWRTRYRITEHWDKKVRADAVAYSPDGAILATAGSYEVKLWHAGTGGYRGPLYMVGGKGERPLAFSPDGTAFATKVGLDNNEVLLSPVEPTEDAPPRLTGHTEEVTSVAFSPDGNRLATTSRDDTTRLWRLSPLRGGYIGSSLQRKLAGHGRTVNAAAFSPDSRTLATVGGWQHSVRLWDARTGEPRKALAGHSGEVMSVAFSPDGRFIATGGADHTVRLWDARTGRLLHTFSGHTGEVTSVAFSPDSTTLATGGTDRTARLWDVALLEPAEAITRICRAVQRNLTSAERALYLLDEEARPMCSS